MRRKRKSPPIRARVSLRKCAVAVFWSPGAPRQILASDFGLSASIIVGADLVTAPPERIPAGLGTSVVIGTNVVVVVPIGVVAMETMVVMMVHVVQTAEGPTGGDGRPRAGDTAAIASAASRSTTRGSVAAARSLTCCHWRSAHGDRHKPDHDCHGRSTDPCHVHNLLDQ